MRDAEAKRNLISLINPSENWDYSKIEDKKSGRSSNLMLPLFVPKAGIEPAHLAVHDFESCASTSSATQAKRPADLLIGLQI